MTFKGLKKYVSDKNSKQINVFQILDNIFEKSKIDSVLDLGCGMGDSVDYFRKKSPSIKWTGLDIESSPEVLTRERDDCNFQTFDGINIPFGDNSLDLIFCNQVLEHVEQPDLLIKEVFRVLKGGGVFIGSVSNLEPYHSNSLWNITPYGFSLLIKKSGLSLMQLIPGIDAITLILRRVFNGARFFNRYFRKESPLNALIGLVGKIRRENHSDINLKKLLFSGQFSFVVKKD